NLRGDLRPLVASWLNARRPPHLHLPRHFRQAHAILIRDLDLDLVLFIRLVPWHPVGGGNGTALLRRQGGGREHIPAATEQVKLIADNLCAIHEDQPLDLHPTSSPTAGSVPL